MNVLLPFIWFLPAYFANASATLSRFLPATHPIDGGRTFYGSRVLGDGKTWEGFFIGVFFGGIVGALLGDPVGGALLSLGAMVGDLAGSFVKRRMGLRRGEEAPLIDQLDFVAGAFLFNPPPPEWGVLIVAVTPLLHRAANMIGHLWGVKREPW